jgi:hypothetical protein
VVRVEKGFAVEELLVELLAAELLEVTGEVDITGLLE